MKILVIAKFVFPPKGGAEVSLITLVRELAKEHEIFAICQGNTERRFEAEGISVHHKNIWIETGCLSLRSILNSTRWSRAITDEVRRIAPNLILTYGGFSPIAVRVARKFHIPVILFIRSYIHFCFKEFTTKMECDRKCGQCLDTWRDKISYPFLREKVKLHEFALKKASYVIANSNFVGKVCKRWYNIEPKVVYPFIELSDYRAKDNSRLNITFVNPTVQKGANIFLDIAMRLKNRDFLVVGKTDNEAIGEKLTSLDNVKYIQRMDDMKKVYAKTRILLVPSIWPEPFGRVCVEAMTNGIPCIVTRMGGLPETVDKAGIVINNIFEPNEWIRTIERFDHQGLYYEFSELSRLRAERFDFKHTYKDFVNMTLPVMGSKVSGFSG